MAGSSFGKAPQGASEIATVRSGTVTMVSLSSETWPFSSLGATGRSLSSESREEYGRSNRIQMLGLAYQMFVANCFVSTLCSCLHFYVVVCVSMRRLGGVSYVLLANVYWIAFNCCLFIAKKLNCVVLQLCLWMPLILIFSQTLISSCLNFGIICVKVYINFLLLPTC